VCYFLDGARRLTGEEGHLRQVPVSLFILTLVWYGRLDRRHRFCLQHEEDEWSYGDWLADVKAGEVARHPALPVVYP
jgi:hypothetical protein